MKDMLDDLAAATRAVEKRTADGTDVVAVSIRRAYDAAPEDVWDAVTDPDRLRRWFSPVSGDLRVGGTFQVEGNAGGEVLACDPPRSFRVTWGGPASVVDLRLSPAGDGTSVEIEHTVPIDIAGSGAGALYVGPGWDLGVLALAGFLRGEVVVDPVAWEESLDVQRYAAGTIDAWATVVGASGTAGAEEVGAATEMARAQFTPDVAAAPTEG